MAAKSVSKATLLKEEGTKYFKEKDLDVAVKYYTQALFFAPYPSEIIDQTLQELVDSCDPFLRDYLQQDSSLPRVKVNEDPILAHCYGNRSAALYELGLYKECLVDIDRAFTSGYPNTTIFKLYKRQALCLAHLGRSDEATSVIQQSKSKVVCSSSKEKDTLQRKVQDVIKEIKQIKPNSNIKEKTKTEEERNYCLYSICTQIFPEKGRGLVAKKDLSFGDCVLSETPYVALLKREYLHTNCSHCFKNSSNLLPCSLCVHTGYCSMSCMQIAWRSYHWLECKNIDDWKEIHWLVMLAMRIILNAPRDDIITIIKECQISSLTSAIAKLTSPGCTDITDVYQTVLLLESHNGLYSDEEQRQYLEKEAWKTVNCVHILESFLKYYDFDQSALDPFSELIKYHMLQFRVNAYAVESVTTIKGAGREQVQELVEHQLGRALYLTGSLFNHSCDPNIVFRFTGNKVIAIISSSNVKKGDELLYCYGPQVGRMKRAKRLDILKHRYLFDCNCNACHNPNKILIYREHAWDGLACFKCKGLLPLSEAGKISQCLDCGHSTDISHHLEIKFLADQLYIEGKTSSSITLLLKCYKEQSRVLFKFNQEFGRTCNAIAFAYARQTVPYCQQSCDAIKGVYGSQSIELTQELPNLAELLLRSEDIRGAVEVARKGLPLMKLFYGADHSDTIQLQNLLKTFSGMF